MKTNLTNPNRAEICHANTLAVIYKNIDANAALAIYEINLMCQVIKARNGWPK